MSSTQELLRRTHVNDHRDANDSTAGDNPASDFPGKPLGASTQALGEWVWCWPGEEEVGTRPLKSGSPSLRRHRGICPVP